MTHEKPIAKMGVSYSGGWGSTERSSESRMNAGSAVWCMIQLLEELLYAQSLDFF